MEESKAGVESFGRCSLSPVSGIPGTGRDTRVGTHWPTPRRMRWRMDFGGSSRFGMTLRRGERATSEDASIITSPNNRAGRSATVVERAFIVNSKIQDVAP